MKINLPFLSAALTFLLITVGGDLAHGQTDSQTEVGDIEEIIVTGSRLSSSGFQTPTPVTILSAEQLEFADPRDVSNALNFLPQFKGSTTPTTVASSALSNFGANNLNLRDLGSQRALVLLDSRRIIPSGTSGSVDINLIPQELIQRVEIVTGGASAAYGSDAVAGVVNFILDKEFEGVKGSVQGGAASVGDSGSYKGTIALGSGFLGNRGHIVASGEIYHIDAIDLFNSKRDWWNESWGRIPSAGGGQPTQIIVRDVTFASANYGGLIPSGPMVGTTFDPSGNPIAFNYGTNVGSNFMIGGDGVQPVIVQSAEIDRKNAFVHANFAVTNSFSIEAEIMVSETAEIQDQSPEIAAGSFALTIYNGNAFLPLSIQQQMDDLALESFRLGKLWKDIPLNIDVDNSLQRFVLGFSGSIGNDWSYKGYYEHGRNNLLVRNQGNFTLRNLYAAVDAVINPANGQIVCRSTLAGLDPGCVPLNPFGEVSTSAATAEYVTGASWYDVELKQDVLDFAVTGDLPLSLGSGPVYIAAGMTYRRESSNQTTDPLSQSMTDFTGVRGGPSFFDNRTGAHFISNFQPLQGSYDVTEGFLELGASLIEGAPFAEELDVNAAVRSADYSTSGAVTPWKVGASYRPVDDLRFRITRSVDIRGANMIELFTGTQINALGSIVDPNTGESIQFSGTFGGNPNVDPEEAKTLTAGFVYQPSWLEGASLSVDWYDIEIDGVIATISAQNTYNQCQAGVPTACAQITELPGGGLRINTQFQNLLSQENTGVDIEASFTTAMGEGDLSLRLLVNGVFKNAQSVLPGAPLIDSSELSGKWSGVMTAGYSRPRYTVFIQQRYVGKGLYDQQLIEGVSIDDNQLPNVWYTDATFIAKIKNDNELFLTVNNVFDRDPPPSPRPSTFMKGADAFRYDVTGRYLSAGVRFSF